MRTEQTHIDAIASTVHRTVLELKFDLEEMRACCDRTGRSDERNANNASRRILKRNIELLRCSAEAGKDVVWGV